MSSLSPSTGDSHSGSEDPNCRDNNRRDNSREDPSSGIGEGDNSEIVNSEMAKGVAPPLGSPAILKQRWSHVSFLHWRVPPDDVAPMMPAGCEPDVLNGYTWVGLIGFKMSRSSFFGGPPVPWLGTFPEVNVRLYSVDSRGRKAVVFRSLEASHLIPVAVARIAFGLPYQWASMKIDTSNDSVRFVTRRRGGRAAASDFAIRPHDEDTPGADSPASEELRQFLTSRWAFHQRHLGRTIYCRNTHEPWPLVAAELLHCDDGLLAAAGFAGLAQRPPDSVLYAEEVSTRFGLPQRL